MARVLFTAGLTMAAGSAHAGVWSWLPSARLNAQYTDNVRLAVHDAEAASSATADLKTSLLRQDDAFSVGFTPRVVAVRYDDYAALNRVDAYVDANAKCTAERGSTALTLSWQQDTTLTSELGSTGLSEVNKRHRSGGATLSGSLLASERISLTGQAFATVHRYVDAENTGLVDYDYGTVAASTVYALAEASQLSLQLSAGRLQVPDYRMLDKNNYALTLNYDTQLNERWHAVLSAGASRVHRRDDYDGFVYEASVDRKSELLTLRFAGKRSITPTGNGTLARSDRLSLQVSRPLTELVSFSVAAAWTRNRNVAQQGGLDPDSLRYGDIGGNLNWRIAPTWTLSIFVGHAEQRSYGNDRNATRNYGGFNLSWSGIARALQ